MTISIPRWLAEQFEADPKSFIPYVGHISGNVVALTSGAAMAQVMVDGRAGFELNAPSMRNGDQDRINTMLRTMSDVDTTICIDLVRHQSVPAAPQPKARSSFVQTLMDDYNRVALSGMYTNTWIISVVVHPETTPGSGVWNYLRRKPEPPDGDRKDAASPRRRGVPHQHHALRLQPATAGDEGDRGRARRDDAGHRDRRGAPPDPHRHPAGHPAHVRVAVVGDLHRARGLWPAVVQSEQARLPAPRRDDRLQQLPGPAARRHVQPIAVRALLLGDAPQLPVQVGRRRGVGASADKPADAQRWGRG